MQKLAVSIFGANEIGERTLGPDHPPVATGLDNQYFVGPCGYRWVVRSQRLLSPIPLARR